MPLGNILGCAPIALRSPLAKRGGKPVGSEGRAANKLRSQAPARRAGRAVGRKATAGSASASASPLQGEAEAEVNRTRTSARSFPKGSWALGTKCKCKARGSRSPKAKPDCSDRTTCPPVYLGSASAINTEYGRGLRLRRQGGVRGDKTLLSCGSLRSPPFRRRPGRSTLYAKKAAAL